jgi:hypothetical protein
METGRARGWGDGGIGNGQGEVALSLTPSKL